MIADTEARVLSGLLADPNLATEAVTVLSPDDFTTDEHQAIYRAIHDLTLHSSGYDHGLILTYLERGRNLEKCRGTLDDLCDPLNMGRMEQKYFRRHAKILRDQRRLRTLVAGCEGLLAAAAEANANPESLIAEAQDLLLKLDSDGREQTGKSAKEVMRAVLAELEEQAKHEGLLGMTTGIQQLDETTTGIRPGELWVVGALPSRGKTALGVQIAGANVEAKVPTVIFSLEMSGSQVGRRLLANYSGVSSARLRRPRHMSKEDWSKVASTAGMIADSPLWVDDASSLSTRQLASRARYYVRRHGVRLIVVDYLMLVQEPTEKERRNKAARIADTMRRIAKEENVGVVLLSQLSRPKDRDLNSRPTMLDLKESGDIEAAAHVVLLIYMPFNEQNEPISGEEELILGKNREGYMGAIPVRYDRSALRFVDRNS